LPTQIWNHRVGTNYVPTLRFYFVLNRAVGWNKRSGSTNRLLRNNKSPLCSRPLTKKSKPCNKWWNRCACFTLQMKKLIILW